MPIDLSKRAETLAPGLPTLQRPLFPLAPEAVRALLLSED
jgi:hypothetical protein